MELRWEPSMNKIRKPAVAGYFYPATRENLLKSIKSFLDSQTVREECIAAICPHAGYVFSGATAGMVYSRIIMPETIILIGPNHTGYGEPFAISDSDFWNTPLGNIKINREISDELASESRYLEHDDIAHVQEHSLEVQVPFIQVLNPQAEIVPITLSGFMDNPAWPEIGESIANVVKKYKNKINVAIIASSDMNHYESQEVTEEKDRSAIDAILALDEDMLVQNIAERGISMCGYGPVIAAIVASKELGAKETELVDYTTSGYKNRDYSQVVGYAGITIK